MGDKVASFLSYTDGGSAFVYNALVDGNYLNPDAIAQHKGWNATLLPENLNATHLAYIAGELNAGKEK